ncbi:MAG: V-type ATP synthase subunit I, partial [Treponemataceae bacterium]
LSMYEIPVAAYSLIPENIQTIFVNEDKNQKRFLVLHENEEKPQGLPAEAYAIPSAEKATDQLKTEIKTFSAEVESINSNLTAFCVFTATIAKAQKELAKEIEFENVFAGMDSEESLCWVTGFVPAPKENDLKKLAKSHNWGVTLCEPSLEDNVPTQLKNSKLVQLLYPLLDFLGTVPGYREFDISAWFLFFFTIFFAMIFGDAGYGSLTLLLAVFMSIKTKAKGETVPLGLQLLTLVSFATVIWGSLNGSWFGTQETLPPILESLILPAFNPKNPESSVNVQIFCFILAVSQLSVAHVVALLRNLKEKSLKFLADLGSLSILWGMFIVVLNLLVSAQRFPITDTILAMIGGGFAASFIFTNYEGNLIKSILTSLSNIISVLLGVINFFSDIVSYIRLWAVGLAGAAIANTVNQMAGPMLGGFIMFAGILLLVFGHGLNMILNVLSVIVHGVRLNTLEFTSHVGMAWSGFKYEPFKK